MRTLPETSRGRRDPSGTRGDGLSPPGEAGSFGDGVSRLSSGGETCRTGKHERSLLDCFVGAWCLDSHNFTSPGGKVFSVERA